MLLNMEMQLFNAEYNFIILFAFCLQGEYFEVVQVSASGILPADTSGNGQDSSRPGTPASKMVPDSPVPGMSETPGKGSAQVRLQVISVTGILRGGG